MLGRNGFLSVLSHIHLHQMMEVINLITCKINGDNFRRNGVKVEHGAIPIISELQLMEVGKYVEFCQVLQLRSTQIK